MRWKSRALKPFARYISESIKRDAAHAIADQEKWRGRLISKASHTLFGKDHGFNEIKSHRDFKSRIPVRDYEMLSTYVEKIKEGTPNVLWSGKPKYFAKTSGTTSGVKYIPISKESIPYHLKAARNALMSFAYRNKCLDIFNGKLIFLSGSPVLHNVSGINTGRLSGIVNHEIPSWIKGNQIPTYETNCIEDWEEKLDAIVKEALQTDLRVISGIPPWIQMFYDKLIRESGKETILDIFPNYKIFAYGGVNFQPYKQTLENLVGASIPSFETYPASEGFIAFQDKHPDDGLLLNSNAGIFYEFVPLSEIHNHDPIRLSLSEVQTGTDYAVIINSNAGLWGYNLGDTVRFISTDPYRLVVSGRVKHFISAFGEHVIGKEVEQALADVDMNHKISVVEFTVAPQVTPQDAGLPYHEWMVEFDKIPDDINGLAKSIDSNLREQNIYYNDLIRDKILQPIVITPLKKGAFRDYMKSIGKLGGQNKVPRLSNDRKIADQLKKYTL